MNISDPFAWQRKFAFLPVLVGSVDGKKIYAFWEFYEQRSVNTGFEYGHDIEFRLVEPEPGFKNRVLEATYPTS